MRSRSSSSSQRGASCLEALFVTLVIVLLLAVLWYFAESCGKRESTETAGTTKPAAAPRYRCLTTPDGLVPVKAVIARPEGIDLRASPSESAGSVQHASAMASYVVVAKEGEFYHLGLDPRSAQGVGWVNRRDILLWTTKEGLQPNRDDPVNDPLLLWPDKRFIGNRNQKYYRQRAKAASEQPSPVLDVDGGRYQIAMRWQSTDYAERGIREAWTDRVAEPQDVRFYYFTTRDDVREMFERVNQSLLELTSGGASDHPLIAFFKEHVGMTVGEQIDMRENDLSMLQRVLRDLRNPISIAEKQPAEIRRDAERMKRDLRRLRDFYQNPDHWNAQGEGWLPRDHLPGR
jgi:hypothetical protein